MYTGNGILDTGNGIWVHGMEFGYEEWNLVTGNGIWVQGRGMWVQEMEFVSRKYNLGTGNGMWVQGMAWNLGMWGMKSSEWNPGSRE